MSEFRMMRIATELIGRPCWRSARCAFVLSTGRVGTKSLVGLANLSDQVDAHHEPSPRLRTLAQRAYHDVHSDADFYRQRFIAARAGRLGWSSIRRHVYFEATNMISFAPIIAKEMPHARFIHLHRHPGDVVRSGMRRGWFGPHPWDRYRVEPAPGDAAHGQWSEWDAFRKICWVWQAVNGFIADFAESIPAERVLTLRFEDMVNPASGAHEQLFSFLNVPCPSHDAVKQVLSIRDNAQETGEFPKYRDWSEQQRLILHNIAGPVMRRLGYDATIGDGYANAA